MKIKLDENLPSRAGSALATAGHDVSTVWDEGLSGASDDVLTTAAASEGRLLMTLDRGSRTFGGTHLETHPGIVVLRLNDQNVASTTVRWAD